MAWAAMWTFVSGFIYTAGQPTNLTFTRDYDFDATTTDNDPFEKGVFTAEIDMVYFEDHVSV